MTIPSAEGLDRGLQLSTRLAVVAFLSGCGEAEFKAVRDGLELSDSTLSKTISTLESMGYISVRKGFVGRRPRTWLALTRAGRQRLAGHLAALQRIAEKAHDQGAAVQRR